MTMLVLCPSGKFLSMALFEMGRQTPNIVPSDVRQIWLDQRRLRYAQVLQLPGFPLCITTANFRL